MRRCAVLVLLALGFVGQAAPLCAETLVYIGTQGAGSGQGIFVARLNEETGALTGPDLAAEIERPTWLAADPARPGLYAVSEIGNAGDRQGEVFSLVADPGAARLRMVGRVGSGGGGPTYLTYDPRLSALFVANFGGGQVSMIPVGPGGRLEPAHSVQTDSGSGPHRRQKGPHAHATVVDPSRRYLLAPDFGADRVFVYRYDRAGRSLAPGDPAFAALPAGSGPRRLVFSSDGKFAFLLTELSAELYSFRWDARTGRLTQLGRIALDSPDFTGTRSAAELARSGDGRFLYVSNRAANAIQVFAIDRRQGSLSEVQRIAGGGEVPWSFAITPSGRWLVVANQGSNSLALFAIDRATGRLTAAPASLSVPRPVAIAFMPERKR